VEWCQAVSSLLYLDISETVSIRAALARLGNLRAMKAVLLIL